MGFAVDGGGGLAILRSMSVRLKNSAAARTSAGGLPPVFGVEPDRFRG